MRLSRLPLAALALLAGPALAEPFAGDAARALLFAPDATEVLVHTVEGLSEDEIALLSQIALGQNYYAAVAFAPAEGILAEPTVMAANFHTAEAARAAALRQCDARRQGGRACAIAFEVRPRDWEPRDLQLSADATAAVAGEYARAGRPRALAISSATGNWGVGSGSDAIAQALGQCRAAAGADDCRVVIQD